MAEEPTTACFAAIDLSKSKWVVAVAAPHLDGVRTHNLPGFDVAGLLTLVRDMESKASGAIGAPCRTVCCFETGYDGFWLQRLLQSEGIETLVLDPTSFLVNRRARQAKTDRIDAEKMVRRLRAFVGGDRSVFRTVRVPSPAEEDAKRIHRERQRLMRERTGHTNRIKALLRPPGRPDHQPRSEEVAPQA